MAADAGDQAPPQASAVMGQPSAAGPSKVITAPPQVQETGVGNPAGSAVQPAGPVTTEHQAPPAGQATTEQQAPPVQSKSAIPLEKRKGGDVTECLEAGSKSDKDIAACAEKFRH
jgi:hypothetical protein